MKMRSLAIAVAAMFMAAAAWAADVTGTWKAEINGPNGSFTLTYSFKQDGSKLTGSVTGPQGDPLELQEGKVEAGKIHFAVNLPFNGGTKFTSDGTIKSDDEISLETKNDSGESFGPAVTLKKQK
jgi:type 1 fimbria pilin